MFEVSRISTDHLPTLADDWNRLSGGLPLRSFAWHANWWKHYGLSSREIYVLVVRDAAKNVVGIAPWCLEARSGHRRVLAWLGSGDVCSDYQSILVRNEDADAVTEALADWLMEASTSRHHAWDLLHLDSVPASDSVVANLVAKLWSAGGTIHREDGPNCWRIELPTTWEEYVDTLSKSHRKQVRRFERRQLETGRATFHTADSAEQWRQGFEILVDLHQRRRQSLGEPGCFASGAFAGFLRDAAGDLFAQDQLRLAWIEIEHVPAAVEFQVAGGNATYAYQAGVNPDLLDEEPGRLINIVTIRRAIEEGQQAFDFLRGDEPYKAHWRAEPHATTTYRIVPQRALAQVRHGLWLAGDNVKNWVKTGLELTGMR